mgnify:CR=1 FL=1
MHFEVVVENVMPIRTKQRDKNSLAVQQADISRIIIEMRPFCRRLIRIHINIVICQYEHRDNPY